MSVPAPNSLECQDLQFKALCRLRVFNSQPGLFSGQTNLVAAAPLYGLIFVGHPNGFQVLPSNSVADLHGTSRGEISEYPRREISLGCMPSHLSVSSDQAQLAVATAKDGIPCVVIYNIASFCSKNVSVVTNIRLTTSPGNKVLDLQFNPGIPQFLATCTSDGGVGVFELKGNNFVVNTLPPATHATSLCWSPKGKQLVVGDSKGSISQFKPDLKIVKSYPPPPDKPSSAIVNLLWISNYQFAAVYTGNPSERPCIMIVNVPKGAPTSYINFEDVCFSSGELRPPQFYMVLQAKWNLMMVASANSSEVGVLAMSQDQVSWQQWTQEDAARAELPLSQDKQDTYPVGLAVDTSSILRLPWGENNSLHPMPMLHILSHQGLLCVFHVINVLPGAVCVCDSPKALPDLSGLDQFVIGRPAQPPQPPQPPPPSTSYQSPQQSPLHSAPVFQLTPSQPQPTASSTPLKQLSSITSQFQPMPQTAKPLALSVSGKSQPSFTSSSSAAPTAMGSTLSFAQPSATGGVTGFSSKTTTNAFNPSGSQTFKPSMPPPSYTASNTSQHFAVPETLQRPSMLVPVPVVQGGAPTSHLTETEPTGVSVESHEVKEEAIDPAIYVDHIQEEIQVFENELKKLKCLVTRELPPIGSEEEKKILFKRTEDLESHIQELTKSTSDLKHDVNDLKTIGLESALWVEDARSRMRQFSNTSYLKLIKAQELDPISVRIMSNIQQMFYYVQNQLSEINKQLNLEWRQHQSSQSPRNDMFVPTMDEIFQTMVKQNGILDRLRITLDDISHRIAKQKLRNSNRIHLINDSALARKSASSRLQLLDGDIGLKSETNLSILAENLLEMKLLKQQSDESDLEALASRALNLNLKNLPADLIPQKQLSSKKEDKLRELLLQIPMARIKVDRTPSEMSSVGQRPCVSFTSSVLAISPRKLTVLKTEKISQNPASSESKTSIPSSLSTFSGVASVPSTTAVISPGLSLSGKPTAITNSKGLTGKPPVSSSTQDKPSLTGNESQQPVSSSEAVRNAPSISMGKGFSKATAQPSVSQKSETLSSGISAGFNFSLPTSAPNIMPERQATLSNVAKPLFSNVGAGGVGTTSSSMSTSKTISFVQPTSTLKQQSVFAVPSAPSSPGVTTSKTSAIAGSLKSTDSLSALTDMVSKAGAPSAAPKGFGDTKISSNVSTSPGLPSFSFSSIVKPSAAPIAVSLPQFVIPVSPNETTKTPITVTPLVSATNTGKQGLLPTPTVSSAQTLFGGALTITPVAATAASPASAVGSSVAAAADSTTSFFGGMGLGGAPMSSSKSPASIFGGTGASLQAGKASSLFGSLSTPEKTTIPATATSAASAIPSSGKVSVPPSTGATSLFGSTATPSAPEPLVASPVFGLGSLASSVAPQTSASGPIVDISAINLTQEPVKAPEPPSLSVSKATTAATPATEAPVTASSSVPSSGNVPTVTIVSSASQQPASSSNLTQSLFGPPITSSKPLFGQAATTSSTTPVFGQAPVTSNVTSLFAPATSGTTPSLFGAPATVSSSTSFTFALPSISTTTSAATATTASTPKAFSFALPAATAATTTPPAFGASATSLFGQATTTTTASTSFFGQTICSPSSTAQTTGTLFGGGTAAVSSAGFSTPTTSTQPLFGQTSAFGSKPSFGQSGGSLFGQSSSSSSGFATPSTNSIFGGGSSSGTSLFGGSTTSSSGNLFQQAASSPSSVFGQTAPSPTTGSFSSSMGGTIGQTGFGTPSSFQARPSDFGAFQSPTPNFGSAPAFGSPPAFGSAPAFGGAPAFGSPNRGVFGSTAPNPGFGTVSPTQSSSTFEALATQDSGVTFGNLAQGGPQSPPTSNLFGASSSSTPFSNSGSSFGGSSFSSWR